jgi:hypothetical protein
MTTIATTTRAAHSATPSAFSFKSFDEVLFQMERTISLGQDVQHMPHHDFSDVEIAGEATADAWVATEASAFAFLRAHSGATAVPMLVETVKNLASLLDIETRDDPTLHHYVQGVLEHVPEVTDKVLRDIVGHEGKDTHERTYSNPRVTHNPLK